jgi:ThiF family/Prokaryotic E2 family B
VRPWVEQFPERLRYELEEFARRGMRLQPDERELQKRKRLVMRGQAPVGNGTVGITVVYPDSFPYLRPEVYCTELILDRHQNPFDGNLCLLDRSTREWDTTDTGAWLVAERLPHLLDLLARGGRALADGEAPQGEPITSYLASATGAVAFVPESALQVPPEVVSGSLVLGLGMPQPVGAQLRCALLSVTGEPVGDGKPWRSPEVAPAITGRFAVSSLRAPWVRLSKLPRSREPSMVIEAVRSLSPQAAAPLWQQAADGQVAVLGILIDEEVRRGHVEPGWVLLVRQRAAAGPRNPVQAYMLAGDRLSLRDLQERTPALSGSAGKAVALAGVGTLGAPLAMELARAQVGELRVLDADHVEAGNTVRWPFGLTAVGMAKSVCLANRIHTEYPFTGVSAFHQQIGAASPPGGQRAIGEASVLTRFLDGADLLIDATAELGINQLLADLARAEGIPLLSIWATEGGWGGAVAEFAVGAAGCWYCLQLRLADGTIPTPPAEPSSNVQPRGCSAPTFSATSFDMLEIVSQAMRAARRLLLAPTGRSMVHVCSTRNADGSERLAPEWNSYDLQAHPECRCCSAIARAA